MPNKKNPWETYVIIVLAFLIGIPLFFIILDFTLAIFKVLFIVLLILLIPGLVKIAREKKKTSKVKIKKSK